MATWTPCALSRAQLIKSGRLVPAVEAAGRFATREPERPGVACLRIDDAGRRAAAARVAEGGIDRDFERFGR